MKVVRSYRNLQDMRLQVAVREQVDIIEQQQARAMGATDVLEAAFSPRAQNSVKTSRGRCTSPDSYDGRNAMQVTSFQI